MSVNNKDMKQKKSLYSLKLLPVAINLLVLLYILYANIPQSIAQSSPYNKYLMHNFLMNINVRDQNFTTISGIKQKE